ncbi:haloacid dehalogenase superfamily, subfamily IA, variant 3 with third motif having DD or ED [Quadrisphaera granulorum]|uniref:HAD superfamily hydrolase (TIGR01509 family) n=1 Tax=Quadrisphaera granulorum TaxID=317664 RepID=A0A316A5J2_9ACTN|nr:HAD family phosphatase [Quadrisphaera granulorum]PWJ53151.1 HAD superfamily hydrolase (TIGR01509 family) [Quadrisphaera granulorum]SZE97083.1 haloacid dehalogenase superfamily, subfamily IA, variant 3 with third motif having DD or ED [Quadrisphaera granulorum]
MSHAPSSQPAQQPHVSQQPQNAQQPQNTQHPLPQAVLWDMDGTLVDTEPYWFNAQFGLVADHGGSWSEDQARSLVGADLRESARRLRTEGGVDLPLEDVAAEILRRVVAQFQAGAPWRPGGRELLAAVRAAGVPCALVTMSWEVLAREFVALLPAGTFDAVVTGDVVKRGKPAPDPYLEAARRLGVDPARCVALEDSTTGISSALAAGVPTVGIPCVVELEARPGLVRVASLEGRDVAWLAAVAAGAAGDEGASTPLQR